MKRYIISSALSVMIAIPSAALEIYNSDDTKADIYGSIRAFVGYGGSTAWGHQQDNLAPGGFLMGIQTNSRFGVKIQSGKFKGNVEFGARENDVIPPADNATTAPFRQFWGSYDTGHGVFLFGKTNSPSFDDAFSSSWDNLDEGMLGFGGLPTAKRHIQLQYNIAGLSLAVLEDGRGLGYTGYSHAQEMPRISASYTMRDNEGGVFLKFAGSYKHYNSTTYNSTTTNNKITFTDKSAYHVWVGLRPTFGESFLSIVAQYGKNGYLYGEQRAAYSVGTYQHQYLSSSNIGIDAQIAGGKLEFGTKLSSQTSFILGAGYLATFGGSNQIQQNSGTINAYALFLQFPHKVNANFEVAPQISYYETRGNKDSNLLGNKNRQAGILTGARIKWDF